MVTFQSSQQRLILTVFVTSLSLQRKAKYNVGGEDGRGGLLVQDEYDESAINKIIRSNRQDGNDDKHMFEKACVDVMKELREANLFTKKDVEDYDLLHHTCFAETEGYMLRFVYLSDWCPEGLKKHRFDNLPLIHAIIEQCYEDIGVFATFLKAATKHHMNEACLLFQYDDDGVTACERAFEKFGKGASIRVIGDCIPFDKPQIPILHHVAKHAPQLLNDFSARYISAVYSRDDNGRNLNQTLLASGKTTFKDDCMYFVRLSDDQVREIDPVTDLYPFMVAASSGISDLSAVYMLLRRNPSLVRSGIKHSNRRRKRKASANNDTKRRNI